MGRHRSDKSEKGYQVATSVMLLDCARLTHWDAEKEFGQLFVITSYSIHYTKLYECGSAIDRRYDTPQSRRRANQLLHIDGRGLCKILV